MEIYSNSNNNQLFEKERRQFKNDDLGKIDPIYFKYINDPYNINILNIINEANRKYQENNKYLVYSCQFMCGGKI